LGHLDADIISPVMPLPVRIETFRLPERETRVLTSIDGKSTLGGISDRMLAGGHASREEVLRAVFIGLSCQILRTPKWFTEI
jgi:hypothetical protein